MNASHNGPDPNLYWSVAKKNIITAYTGVNLKTDIFPTEKYYSGSVSVNPFYSKYIFIYKSPEIFEY